MSDIKIQKISDKLIRVQREEDVRLYAWKLVRVQKEKTCIHCGQVIPVGEMAFSPMDVVKHNKADRIHMECIYNGRNRSLQVIHGG